MTRGLRRLVALLAVFAMLLTACGGDDDDGAGGEQSAPGTAGGGGEYDPNGVARVGYDLVSASKGGFSWDPSVANTNVGDTALFQLVYGSLMRPAPDGTLVPELAESAEVVDQTTIDIVLRDGITYADGTPFGPEVVKAQYDTMLANPDLPAYQRLFHSLEEVTITGDRSLRLTIPDGTAPGWYDNFMGGVEAVIVPPNVDFSRPSGAGPFMVTEFRPEVSIALEKNPDYWNADEIELGGIEVVHTQVGGNAQISALNAGQVDFVAVEFSQLDALAGQMESLIEPTPYELASFQACMSRPPFDDPQVRVALGRGIDREAINDALFGGTGVPAYSVWPEGHRFYLDGLDEEYGYDPEAARQLLAEAGYPDGLTFDVLSMNVSGMPEVAQIVQQQWAEIGVTMNITVTPNIVQDLYIDQRAPMGLIPVLGLTPRLNRWTAETTNNLCLYNDPELNEMAAELTTVSASSQEAVDLWHEIQEKMTAEGIGTHVIYGSSVHAYNPERLDDVAVPPHHIGFPDVWSLKVRAE